MNDKASNVVPARLGLEAQQAELADRIARYVPGDGLHPTAIPGLCLIRASEPSQPLPTVYHAGLCVVVQGRKRALLGEEVYRYDPLNYLVVSMTLPMTGQIVEASPEHPYLCLRIDIEPGLIGELLDQAAPPTTARLSQKRALYVARTEAPLLDAVLRLVRLLDAPEESAVLAPLAMREIHYRVLTGELGQRMRELCEADGPARRIARAIELLKHRYAEPLRIDELAAAAHMSASSLHQRFKAATAMSPLLMEGLEAASAGHKVGYESPSQFSREYRRLFGAPPKREIEAIRAAGG